METISIHEMTCEIQDVTKVCKINQQNLEKLDIIFGGMFKYFKNEFVFSKVLLTIIYIQTVATDHP